MESTLNILAENDKIDKEEIAESFVELGDAVRRLNLEIVNGLREVKQSQAQAFRQFNCETKSNIEEVSMTGHEEILELSVRLETLETTERTEAEAVEVEVEDVEVVIGGNSISRSKNYSSRRSK